MEHRTLEDMRTVAERAAVAQGHRLRRWRRDDRHHFRFTSRCESCGAWIEVTNRIHTPEEADRAFRAGAMIARDPALTRTDHDYVIGLGEALISRCR
jgi:hypothetical protein